jgi:hypothetical protein
MRVVSKAAAFIMLAARKPAFSQHQTGLFEINKLFLTVTANVNKAVYAPVC